MAHVTLEQWRALQALADEGSFERAAEVLGKSQSSVSYAVQRLEAALAVPVLRRHGRRTRLTDTGEILLRRARRLLDEAAAIERLADAQTRGWEAEVRLAVEVIFPVDRVFDALSAFDLVSRGTRVRLVESVLSGTDEALLRREVELAVTPRIPPGFLGDPLLQVVFVAVAHPDHALHHMGREINEYDLAAHRQIVVRDTGVHRSQDAGWLGAEQRWTFSHPRTSIEALCRGLGFAWLPREHVAAELESGRLKQLPLREGGTRPVTLHLVFADRDGAGPATQALARALRDTCADRK